MCIACSLPSWQWLFLYHKWPYREWPYREWSHHEWSHHEFQISEASLLHGNFCMIHRHIMHICLYAFTPMVWYHHPHLCNFVQPTFGPKLWSHPWEVSIYHQRVKCFRDRITAMLALALAIYMYFLFLYLDAPFEKTSKYLKQTLIQSESSSTVHRRNGSEGGNRLFVKTLRHWKLNRLSWDKLDASMALPI